MEGSELPDHVALRTLISKQTTEKKEREIVSYVGHGRAMQSWGLTRCTCEAHEMD